MLLCIMSLRSARGSAPRESQGYDKPGRKPVPGRRRCAAHHAWSAYTTAFFGHPQAAPRWRALAGWDPDPPGVGQVGWRVALAGVNALPAGLMRVLLYRPAAARGVLRNPAFRRRCSCYVPVWCGSRRRGEEASERTAPVLVTL